MSRPLVVGVTGASGAVYALRLLRCLAAAGVEVHAVFSPMGRLLFADELDMPKLSPRTLLDHNGEGLTLHSNTDLSSKLASGSFLTGGMVICPCSSHTLGSVAAGLGDSLLLRAAQVTLKEARRLVLVTREMPMSRIDLENALRLSNAGAIICPAAPGFYLGPRTIDDLVDFVVGKVMDLLSAPHDLHTRWEPERKNRRSNESHLERIIGEEDPSKE